MTTTDRTLTMLSRRLPIQSILVATLLLVAPLLNAGSLTFKDQSGMPIEHVVVELDVNQAARTDALPVMDQIEKQFVPRVLIINAGQSVRFPNSDNIRHHVYSFSTPKVFEIKLFKGMDADPVQFDVPGIVVLGCNIHDHMVGYIYVSDGKVAMVSGADGQVMLPDEAVSIRVWHPRLSPLQGERMSVKVGPEVHTLTLDLMPEKKQEKKRSFKPRFQSGT